MSSQNKEHSGNYLPWINPIGGYGDMLMLSGVLKIMHDIDPTKKVNLAARTKYSSFFKGHPAIGQIGFPPKDARILRVDYWSMEKLGPGNQRPFQILARAFGLKTPVAEKLYISGEVVEDEMLDNFIPWKRDNVLISPASDSPRKMADPARWHHLVQLLKDQGVFVMQAGSLNDLHIRNAFSILGLTTPRQLIRLLRKCDLVITLDNFIMHAASMTKARTIVLWGPTSPDIYGYSEHSNFRFQRACGLQDLEECIAPEHGSKNGKYGTRCPHGNGHCMDQFDPHIIYQAAIDILSRIKK